MIIQFWKIKKSLSPYDDKKNDPAILIFQIAVFFTSFFQPPFLSASGSSLKLWKQLFRVSFQFTIFDHWKNFWVCKKFLVHFFHKFPLPINWQLTMIQQHLTH